MKLDEINQSEMFVFVAPDGSPQLATLAPDYAMCVAFTQVLAKKGISKHPAQLFREGYSILMVQVTIKQVGDEESAFAAAKKKLG